MKKKKHILGKILLGMIILSALGKAGGYTESTEKPDNVSVSRGSEIVRTADEGKEDKDTAVIPDREETGNEDPEKGTSGIRPELREYLESYERFIDEYCEFMQDYDASDTSLLIQYGQLISRLYEFEEASEKWDESDMNDEEDVYYTEVMFRTSQKLLKVSIEMQ